MKNLDFWTMFVLASFASMNALGQETKDLSIRMTVPWQCSELSLTESKAAIIVDVFSENTKRVPYFGPEGPRRVLHYWKRVNKTRRFEIPMDQVKIQRISTRVELAPDQAAAKLRSGVPVFFKNKSQAIHPIFLKGIKQSAIVVNFLDQFPSEEVINDQ